MREKWANRTYVQPNLARPTPPCSAACRLVWEWLSRSPGSDDIGNTSIIVQPRAKLKHSQSSCKLVGGKLAWTRNARTITCNCKSRIEEMSSTVGPAAGCGSRSVVGVDETYCGKCTCEMSRMALWDKALLRNTKHRMWMRTS